MHVLAIYAHPEPRSFTGALLSRTVAVLADMGHTVEVSDLYESGFDARLSPADFIETSGADYFSIQTEQAYAESFCDPVSGESGYVADVEREQQRVARAQLVIFLFPLWWGGPPAIVKGWIDRVMSYGFAYADGSRYERGYFRGRDAIVCVSTGGSASRFSNDGVYGEISAVLWPLQRCVIEYLGFTRHDPFVAYGAPRLSDADRSVYLDDWERRLRTVAASAAKSEPRSQIRRGTVEVEPLTFGR